MNHLIQLSFRLPTVREGLRQDLRVNHNHLHHRKIPESLQHRMLAEGLQHGMLANQRVKRMSMDLMEIGTVRENRSCHRMRDRMLVEEKVKPKHRLQKEIIQKLSHRAEQLSQRAERNLIVMDPSPIRHMV